MTDSFFQFLKRKISTNPKFGFWLWQAGFWLFVSIVSFSTLTLWYGPFNFLHIAHILVQALMGLVFSLLLYWVFMRVWHKSTRYRATVGLLLVLAVAFVWTIVRVEVFFLLTEDSEWDQFGGWLFASIFIFLCWTGMFHGIRYFQLLQFEHRTMLRAEAEAREEQLKRMKAQSVARDAQIKMLRYQLNPHFLCNTLNAINALVEAQETEIAQGMTVKLSKFLRHSLDNNPDTKIALEHEIKALNLYLDIEKIRFGERLKLDFQISELANAAKVPSLLLQPIIENSMKHAIARSEEGGTIKIYAVADEDWLTLEVSDTGSGGQVATTKIKSATGRGVGVRNTMERLEALYAKMFEYDVKMMPSGGLKTRIKIPFEPHQDLNSLQAHSMTMSS